MCFSFAFVIKLSQVSILLNIIIDSVFGPTLNFMSICLQTFVPTYRCPNTCASARLIYIILSQHNIKLTMLSYVFNVGKDDLCEHTCSLMAQVIYVSIHNLCWKTNTMMA